MLMYLEQIGARLDIVMILSSSLTDIQSEFQISSRFFVSGGGSRILENRSLRLREPGQYQQEWRISRWQHILPRRRQK